LAGRDGRADGDSGRIWAGFAAPANGVKIEVNFRVDFLAWRTVVFDTMMTENKLTDVEEQVLTAFRAGGISVVDADGAEISGDFLRDLFLDENADYRGTCIANAVISDVLDMGFCETKFPVRFHNCYFVREINLQHLTCPELDFRGCTLIRSFDARMVKVSGSVNLAGVVSVAAVSLANAEIGGQLVCTDGSFLNKKGCTFHAPDIKVAVDVLLHDGFIAVGEVNLSGADIGRQLVCTGGNFWNGGGNAINAQSIEAGDVLLNTDSSDSQNVNEFRAIGTVWLAGADIGGRLVCTGGNFHNKGKIALNAECVKAVGGVVLNDGFNAEGVVSLAGAEIGGQLACAGGSFRDEESGNALIAPNIKVVGNVFLHDGFKSNGTVNLLGAAIDGQLICTGGNFRNKNGNALMAQGISVVGNVLLNTEHSDDGSIKKFEAVGVVSLAYANIGGQLACNGGSFRNKGQDAINAQGIKVAGDVLLEYGFRAEGSVSFLGADIGGQLSCRGGSFQNEGGNALVAQGIKVGSGVFLIAHVHDETKVAENFSASGWVLFDNAIIGGNLKLEGCEITHLSLSGADVSGEFRDDAGVYKDHDDNDIVLNIDGFRYHRLNTTEERTKDRLAWAGSMSKSDKFYPQPYEQLMRVYRETGHMNWAREAGFALENARHEKMQPGWWKKWYWLLRHTIGYGYKPFRAIYWFGALILAGFVLFSGSSFRPDSCRAGSEPFYCMAPSDAGVLLSDDWKIHGKLPKDYPGFNSFYYAVEAALPVLPLGQTQNWHPKTWWARGLQGAITIIGALVLTILASYGVGVLGPRWKNE